MRNVIPNFLEADVAAGYDTTMSQYSLRTLILVMLLGGPVLAASWFSANWVVNHPVASLVGSVLVFMLIAATALAVNLKRLVRAASARIQRRISQD
jgi:hypothetical protein